MGSARSYSRRLCAAMQVLGFNAEQLAALTGLGLATVLAHTTGGRTESFDGEVSTIAAAIDCSHAWLARGALSGSKERLLYELNQLAEEGRRPGSGDVLISAGDFDRLRALACMVTAAEVQHV